MLLAGYTILVVDDEPILNMTMSLVLRQEGATVLSATNGAQALQMFDRSGLIDAMICDQNMPVMDGRTLISILHRREQSVPTLFFVSGVDREDAAALEAMQVCRLITKPIQPAALISAVRSVLDQVRRNPEPAYMAAGT